mgnify:CR=1 FL=1
MRRWGLAVLAVVLYNSWVAWPLNGDPGVLLGYISELAAADQPFSWFFRTADYAAAAVYAAIAALGWRGWAGWLGRRSRHVAVALMVVAVGTALDATFNLPCAESRDAACAAAPSIQRHLHEVASVVVSSGQVATIGLVAWGRSVRRGWTRAVKAVASLAVLVAGLLVTTAVAPYLWPGSQGPVQIVQIVLCSVWVGYLAWRLPGRRRG